MNRDDHRSPVEHVPTVITRRRQESYPTEESRALVAAMQNLYSAINAAVRAGASLDDAWDPRLDAMYNRLGDMLWPGPDEPESTPSRLGFEGW